MAQLSPRAIRQTYAIAHTARCKLQLSADRPDRDLRFILGHAFTLDKLNLRIAEIETSSSSSYSSDSDSSFSDNERPVCTGGGAKPMKKTEGTGAQERRVSFQGRKGEVLVGQEKAERRRSSPPPAAPEMEDDTDSDDEDGIYDDYDDNSNSTPSLGLQRFGSAAAQAPKILEQEQGYEGEDDAGIEDVGVDGLAGMDEEEIKELCAGRGDEGLVAAYERVAGCPCHGEKGPHVENFWEMTRGEGEKRMVVMQVA